LKRVAGRLHPVESHRRVQAGQHNLVVPITDHFVKYMVLFAVFQKLLNREPSPVVIRAIRQVLHDHYGQATAVRVRERVEHRAFDHAEHRRGGADAERERDSGQDGEAQVLAQHPQAVAQVLQQGLHGDPLRGI